MKPAEDKKLYKIHTPTFLPDILEGQYLFGNVISLPVSNFHSSHWLQISKVMIVEQTSGVPLTFQLAGESRRPSIAPGQTAPVIIKMTYKHHDAYPVKPASDEDCANVHLVLKLVATKGQNQHFDLELRCRKLKESFLFTFVDHDGSVQHAAAIAPLKPCEGGSCPVLLTLHGTSK